MRKAPFLPSFLAAMLFPVFVLQVAQARLQQPTSPAQGASAARQSVSSTQQEPARKAETNTDGENAPHQVRSVLDAQVAAWNRGNLEGYMAGYWKSPDLTFFSGATATKGWQPTLDRYRKHYQSDGREMGKLEFSDVTIETLGPEAAVARGRWHLVMKSGQQPKGMFTVIFRKFPEGWRIIHDHSSGE